jgi:membrane AbrB-like protein
MGMQRFSVLRSRLLCWLTLAGLSLALAASLTAAHLPAAVLIGCMIAGITLAVRGQVVRVSPRVFALAQAVLGCLMARSLKPSTLHAIAVDWPLLLGVSLLLMAASSGLGWILMQRRVFAGNTAVWGLAPGAASAMVLMADAHGADARLVAFMQYARVAVVTSVASFVAWPWCWAVPSWGAGCAFRLAPCCCPCWEGQLYSTSVGSISNCLLGCSQRRMP